MSIFAKKTMLVILFLVVVGELIFHIHNLIVFNPYWGYDGPSHIAHIQYIATHLSNPPLDIYSASNPPLYYWLSAAILKAFNSIKIVQLFSFVLYLIEVILMYFLLKKYSDNKFLNISITIFFSLLPVSLEMCYMIFNYPLGNFFSILIIYMLCIFDFKQVFTYKHAIALGLVIGLGILTSLTNVAFLIAAILFFLFNPYCDFKKRIAGAAIVIILCALLVVPYAVYSKKNTQCFLCTTNRVKTKLPISKVYPIEFYYKFDFSSFSNAYYPNKLYTQGLWTTLHETLYGDYQNYLVGPHLASENKNSAGLILTSPHYVDERKIESLKILNYLGLPISLLFIITFAISSKRAIYFIFNKKNRKKYFPDFFLMSIVVLLFAQFMDYLLQYPDYVNIHAGYIYPLFFIGSLLVVKNFRNKVFTSLISIYVLIYAAVIYGAFWLY